MKPLCDICKREIVEANSIHINGGAAHVACLSTVPELLPLGVSNSNSSSQSFSATFEVTLDDCLEAREEMLKLPKQRAPVVYVDELVPLTRSKRDEDGVPTGESEDVLCWLINNEAEQFSVLGYTPPRSSSLPMLLVHPNRVEEFERRFGLEVTKSDDTCRSDPEN